MTARAGRDAHVAAYLESQAMLHSLDRLDANGVFATRRLESHREFAFAALRRAADDYEASLAPVALSRCPHTGVVGAPRIDVSGLAGRWWNHDVPRRPLPTGLPDTLVGIDGTIRLEGAPPRLPFTVGLLYEATDGWTMPLVLMIALVAPMLVLASYVGRPIYVEDQLHTTAEDLR